MKTIFLDINNNTQKITSGNVLFNTAVYADYIKNDIQVINVGVEFTHNGDNFRAMVDDGRFCISQLVYSLDIKTFIETKSGAWKFDKVKTYNLSNTNVFIYDTLDANFGTLVRNGDTIGCISEYQFFLNCIGKGVYPNPFKMTLFDAFENLLRRIYA